MLAGGSKGVHRVAVFALVLVAASALPFAATAQSSGHALVGRVQLYTSVTQDTIDAVLAVLAEEQPGLQVDVFRAPTGELDARIAAELRSGGLMADVLWLTDPLSAQQYESADLLAPLEAGAFEDVPEAYRSETFVGTRILNLVIVAGADVADKPLSWAALADPSLAGSVALPDPGFAGSAFAALGYFATADDMGMDFYQRLKDNGAVQLSSPGEVLDGVAEGRYAAGITLDNIARSAAEKGAPVELIWPEPGAIALYSPAAVAASSDDPAAAAAFLAFLVSPTAQAAIAETGWQPVHPDVAWPYEGPTVAPAWGDLFGQQETLLADYRAIFGD